MSTKYWNQFYFSVLVPLALATLRDGTTEPHLAYLRWRFGPRWPLAWLYGCTIGAFILWRRRREIREAEARRYKTCKHTTLDKLGFCTECRQQIIEIHTRND
jgi:hypothetical protein